MSTGHLALSTDWTEAELANQLSQWQAITDISSAITQLADAARWEDILSIAESRQTLIDQFFQTPICVPLFQQILIDLEKIQAQHQQVMVSVEKGLTLNDAKQTSLIETRESINEMFPEQK